MIDPNGSVKIMLKMQPVHAPALVSEMERVSADRGARGLMALHLARVMMNFRIQTILGARIITVAFCGVVVGKVLVGTTTKV